MPRRRQPRWSEADDTELARRWHAGEPGASIARALGRTPAAVYVRRQAIDLPARDDSPAAKRQRAARGRAIRDAQFRSATREPAALTDADARWLAGVLDSVGSIGVYQQGAGSASYSLRITVASRSRALIAAAQQAAAMAGSVRHRQRAGKTLTTWTWTVDGYAAVMPLLRAIRPHMRARGELADIVLRYPVLGPGEHERVPPAIEAERAAVARAASEWTRTVDLPATEESMP